MGTSCRLTVCGRLAAKPRAFELKFGEKKGTLMAYVMMAVPVQDTTKGRPKSAQKTFWLRLVAWGDIAKALREHEAEETVAVAGDLRYSEYTNPTTKRVTQYWECAVEGVISERTEFRRALASRHDEPTVPLSIALETPAPEASRHTMPWMEELYGDGAGNPGLWSSDAGEGGEEGEREEQGNDPS